MKKIMVLLIPICLWSCYKDFLDVKRDRNQVVPTSLNDYFYILENSDLNSFSSHSIGEIGSDDYTISDDQWALLTNPVHKNAYIWNKEIYEGESWTDWNRGYEKILIANFVIEGVKTLETAIEENDLKNQILGSAYFHRGLNFFNLAQLFCGNHEEAKAHDLAGLPLRTSSNTNISIQRASLNDTYDLILSDLDKAVKLLPASSPIHTRPSKCAAMGVLAKVYLQMGMYGKAVSYADSALQISDAIIDYNSIDPNINEPFSLYGIGNREVIFYSSMPSAAILSTARLTVDSLLYSSYDEADLRKSIFFFNNNGRTTFKGSYSGTSVTLFSGLTVPELVLIYAECQTRLGNIGEAADKLQSLRRNRYKSEISASLSLNSSEDILRLILSERRKELIYRGIRWADLKRFDKEPLLAKTLVRKIANTQYSLKMGSHLWIWPIPPDAISIGGYQQNER